MGNIRQPDGVLTQNDSEKAITLNNHFITVFTDEDCNTLPNFPAKYVDNKCDSITITNEQISKCINSLKTSKSQGPERYTSESNQRVVLVDLIEPLTIIGNKSVQEGKLPKMWKTANVTSIYKAGDRFLAENYRPISITPICCRILEKIIRIKLVEHLANNNILSIFQHGFRQGIHVLLSY